MGRRSSAPSRRRPMRRSPEASAIVLHGGNQGAGAGPSARGRYSPPAMEPDRDPELFRDVFGHFATGVAVITSAGAASAGGMTANAICSLSLDPLLALVCFENSARTLPIVRESGRFGVN